MSMTERILQGAEKMGISLPGAAAGKMSLYWDEVLRVNQTMNLTRIVEEDAACADHFLDSLAPMLWGEELLPNGASVLDVGTGAGFPGVPLALARPDLRVTLLDARRKKIHFIEETLLGMRIERIKTLHARAEEVKGTYDVVSARAVTALPALCALLLPLVKPGGLAIMWKGPAVHGELRESDSICRAQSAKLFANLGYEIPGMVKERRLVVGSKRAVSGEFFENKGNPCRNRRQMT